MAWFPIINLYSDQVTLPWICCFCSPINGWRSSMPDMKSEPSHETYHLPSIQSGTLLCSPNSLPMVSKDISIHASQTSSPVATNVCRFLEFSHSLFLSRLEFLKAVPQHVLCPVLFLVFINDLSDSWENPFYVFADDFTRCCTICHPSGWQAAASSLSEDLDKITSWSNTWNQGRI